MESHFQYRETGWKRVLLTALVIATCLRIWIGPVTWEPQAQARIPDAGKQRQNLVEEVRQTNVLLTRILNKLEGGTFNVRVEGTDKHE